MVGLPSTFASEVPFAAIEIVNSLSHDPFVYEYFCSLLKMSHKV